MNAESILQKAGKHNKIDRRDLVNIDLYYNEIKVMQDHLHELVTRHPNSKPVYKKVEQLKKELGSQRENLDKFKQSCATGETRVARSGFATKSNEAFEREGFFDRLKA